MLHLQVDPHSGVPVYRQMMDQVKYYIASGVLRPGAQLPSVRELAQFLRVNPTTVVGFTFRDCASSRTEGSWSPGFSVPEAT